jgi:hypothetical protein
VLDLSRLFGDGLVAKKCWHCGGTKRCSCITCCDGLGPFVRDAACIVCKPKTKAAPVRRFDPLVIPASDTQIGIAQTFRKAREQRSNLMDEQSPFAWCGDLGEIIFDAWLREQAIAHWWDPRRDLLYDFVIGPMLIDVKTVSRSVYPQKHFTHFVNCSQFERSTAGFYFLATYVAETKQLCMIGGCPRDVVGNSNIVKAGDRVHGSLVMAKQVGGKCFDVKYSELVPMSGWIEELKNAGKESKKR